MENSFGENKNQTQRKIRKFYNSQIIERIPITPALYCKQLDLFSVQSHFF